uniref:hypothetical protein n=1 Tax=Alistipes sp. TaxID=1872444 RepID=UPI004055A73A
MEWNEMIAGHQFMRDDFMRDEEPNRKAYKRGFEDGRREGWRKAMEEAQRSFHERRDSSRQDYGQRDGYAERNITGNDYSFDPRRDGFNMREGHDEEIERVVREAIQKVKAAMNERRH